MKPYKNTIKSITYDNGYEFSMLEKLTKNLIFVSHITVGKRELWEILMV